MANLGAHELSWGNGPTLERSLPVDRRRAADWAGEEEAVRERPEMERTLGSYN